ncbi:hypothetical protein HY412_00880 [Candidatus Kaiserbacteria bacterium]|nr:hypothetical protein [Candidatus Kaiserbacteria bacterium]
MNLIGQALLGVSWFVPVIIYVVINYLGVRSLNKHLANQPDQIKRITVNMFFCACAGALFALVTGNLRFDSNTYFVMGVGVLNAFANIMQWRATKVSMSKTSMLSFGDDIIAVLLAWVIIGDGKYLNGVSASGMVLCLLTGILFWWHSNKTKAGKETSSFYFHVLAYCMLWGIAIFSQRYFAFNNLSVAQFVFAWYLGSFLTMAAIFTGRAVVRTISNSGEKAIAFRFKDYAIVFVYALGIAGGLAIEYWAKILAPLTVVQPIFLVSEAVIPTIIGWTIFRERKTFDRAQWSFSALGFTGVILLAFGFHGF